MYKQYLNNFTQMNKVRSKYCGCLYFSANALAREMTKMADDAFVSTGLSSSLAFVLMSVAQEPGITPGEIGLHMQLSPSTVTRLIEKLEYKKLLYRETSGRKTFVWLTETGSHFYPQILICWKNLFLNYSKILGEEFAKDLTSNIYEAAIKIK